MTRLGYQIPNFTYPGIAPDGIFQNVVEQARAAEAAGYDRVFVMDHFYQLPGIGAAEIFGYRMGVMPEAAWHMPDLQGEYFWNPIKVIEGVSIPVLAIFGEKDTQVDPIQGAQAYREALERAGNRNFRVELIPGSDHNIILSETGCLEERENRARQEWTNYAPEYLDLLEDWLRELRH